jgi:hypothetical protein
VTLRPISSLWSKESVEWTRSSTSIGSGVRSPLRNNCAPVATIRPNSYGANPAARMHAM